MRILFLILIFIFGIGLSLKAQTSAPDAKTLEAYRKVREQTNRKELEEIARKAEIYFRDNKARALDSAKKYGWEIRTVLPDSSVIELMGIDEKGKPIYYTTQSNLDAARTIRTDRVWIGGAMGLNLNGAGLLAGEWDAGRCRPTHVEFQTGVGTRIINGDGAGNDSHATHVGGTIVAAGLDGQAKGMAHMANLKSFDWNSDDAEMATEGANGLLVSNHSYGELAGWSGCRWYGDLTISTTLDYRFGLYTGSSVSWDNIAYNAPYYLICKAAGNDRGNNCGGSWEGFVGGSWVTDPAGFTRPPADGQYDCISTYGNAKNILTVAAVNDQVNYTGPASVTMSGFSSWGPTDDGRIKPDISANGVSLYSTEVTNDNAYSNKSGTSMATPTVTGSALLIQEHSKNLTGSFMRAATLKGLIIQTADETGSNPGPDYAFGWGLMNTGRAVQHITDNNRNTVLREEVLNPGQTYTLQVYSDGTQPLRATICWNDPAGTPNLPQLNNRSPRLVNDLDLRITGGTTVQPWILDPDNPAAAATRGDNIRDNVEQVHIQTPAAGLYTITVTHKNTLTNGNQPFSLLVSQVNCFAAINTLSTLTYCAGQTVNLTANTGTGLTYQWSLNGTDIIGAVAPTFSATVSGAYRVRVTNGGCSQTSLPVNLTFNPATVAGTLTGTATVCAGSNVNLTLTGNVGNVLRWESSTDNFITVNTINQTVNNLTINAISATTRFRAVVQSTPCTAQTSNNVLITVNGNGGTTSGAATVCADNNFGTIPLTGNSGPVVFWEISTDNFVTVNNVPFLGSVFPYSNLSTTTQFRARTSNPGCPPAFSTPTTITATPQPNITVSAAPASPACNPASVDLISVYTPAPPFNDCNRYTLQTMPAVPFPHTGTNVFGSSIDDGISGVIPIGFTFNHYCNDFTQLRVSSNGFLSFQNNFTHGCCNGPNLPANDGIDNVISAVWTDCMVNNADDVKYQTVGTAPDRKFVLSFGNTFRYYGGSTNISTQIVLHETTNLIDIIAVNIPASSFTRTMGIENGNGTLAVAPPGRNARNTWSDVNNSYRFIPFNSRANFSYSWSNPSNGFSAITPNATDNSPFIGTSTYSLIVSHAGTGCSKTYNIPYEAAPLTVGGTVSANATVCSGANSGNLTLTGHTGNVVRWESSTDNFITVNTINNLTPSLSYSNLTQTTRFRAVVKSGACLELASTFIQITADPLTVPGTLSGDATVCSGVNSGNMTLSGFTGSILRWESSTDNFVTINVINNTTPGLSFSNLTQTTRYRVLVRSGVCNADYSNPVTITVDPPTVGGTVSSDMTLCQSSASGTVFLSGQTGNVIRWESSTDNFITVNTINHLLPVYTFTALTQSTRFRAVVKSGVCNPLASSSVQVTVDLPSVAGTISPNVTICETDPVPTISVSGNTGTAVNWESSTDNFITATVIPVSALSYSPGFLTQSMCFRALIQNGVCPGVYTSASCVTVDPTSIAGTPSAAQTICIGNNPDPIVLSGQRGSVVRWESSEDNFTNVTIIPYTAASYLPLNLTRTTQFRAVVKSGVCAEVTTAPLQITVDNQPVGGTISANATHCGTGSGNLVLNGFNGNILNWESSTDNFTTLNVINNNFPSYSYSNLTQTTYFRARLGNGVCTPVYSSVAVITVHPLTVAGTPAGASTVCYGNNTGTVKLSGQVGNIVRWESSTDNFTTVQTIVNSNVVLNYLNLTRTTSYRVVVQSGPCQTEITLPITVTVDPQTVGGAITPFDVTVCGNASGTLTLNNFTGTITGWESSTDNFSTVTPINHFSPVWNYSNLTRTTYFRVKVKSGVCEETYSLPAVIRVDEPTIAGGITGPASVCISSNSGTLNLNSYVGNILRWEVSTDNGFTYNVINNQTPVLNFSNLPVEIPTLYRAAVASGVCAMQYTGVFAVSVNPETVAGTAGPSATVCASASNGLITLAGNTGNILRWESSTDNFNIVNTLLIQTNSLSYHNLTQTTAYRAVVQSGVCAERNSNIVTVTVDVPPVGGMLAGSATVCGGNNSGTLTLSGFVGQIKRWESSDRAFSGNITVYNNTGPVQNYSNLTRMTWFRAVVGNGVCSEVYSSFTLIQVTAPPVGGTVSGNTTVCSGVNSGRMTLRGNAGYVVRWESSADNWATVNTIANVGTVHNFSNLSMTTAFRAVVSSGNICPVSFSAPATITVNPNTSAGTLTGNATVCGNSGNGSIVLSGNVGSIVFWQRSENNGQSWTNFSAGNTFNYSNLTRTTFYRVQVRHAPCGVKVSNTVRITVQPASVAGNLTADASHCGEINTGTLRLMQANAPVIFWETSTDNFTTVNTLPSSGQFLTYTNLTQTTRFRAVVQGQLGVCPQVRSSSVQITILESPSGGTLASDASVCDNQTAVLTLTGQRGNILHWERSDDNWQTVFTIANTLPILTVSNLNRTSDFRVRMGSASCGTAVSSTSKVTVNRSASGGMVMGVQNVCSDDNMGLLYLNGHSGEIIRWESSSDGWQTINTITNNASSHLFRNLTRTTSFRAVLRRDAFCGDALSVPLQVNVYPRPVSGLISGESEICLGSEVVLTVSQSVGSLKYQYSSDNWRTFSEGIPGENGLILLGNLSLNTAVRVIAYSTDETGNVLCSDTSAVHLISVREGLNAGTLQPVYSGNSNCANPQGFFKLMGYTGSVSHWEFSNNNWATVLTIGHTNDTLNFSRLPGSGQVRAVLTGSGCNPVRSGTQFFAAGLRGELTAVTGCDGTGMITVSASGGYPPYRYFHSQRGISNVPIFAALLPGTHRIIVLDSRNCAVTLLITVTGTASAPLIVAAGSNTPTNGRIVWTETPGAVYEVRFRPVGHPVWTTVTVNNGLEIQIDTLRPGTPYETEVRASCPTQGNFTAWSDLQTFATLSLKEELTYLVSTKSNHFTIYPNPAQSYFTVEYLGKEAYIMELIDMTGKVLIRKTISGGSENNRTDASGWAAGMYLIRITLSDGTVKTQKISISQ